MLRFCLILILLKINNFSKHVHQCNKKFNYHSWHKFSKFKQGNWKMWLTNKQHVNFYNSHEIFFHDYVIDDAHCSYTIG